jgi:hypothetical protein
MNQYKLRVRFATFNAWICFDSSIRKNNFLSAIQTIRDLEEENESTILASEANKKLRKKPKPTTIDLTLNDQFENEDAIYIASLVRECEQEGSSYFYQIKSIFLIFKIPNK